MFFRCFEGFLKFRKKIQMFEKISKKVRNLKKIEILYCLKFFGCFERFSKFRIFFSKFRKKIQNFKFFFRNCWLTNLALLLTRWVRIWRQNSKKMKRSKVRARTDRRQTPSHRVSQAILNNSINRPNRVSLGWAVNQSFANCGWVLTWKRIVART